MKYARYLSIAVLALLLFAFAPNGKRKKATLPTKAIFGHVQWIREVSYHAVEDSSGSITRGDIMGDTGYYTQDERIKSNMARKVSVLPIETWTYDEYGDEIEHDKYHADGSLYSKEIHTYNENGDVKEVIDSSISDGNVMALWRYQLYTYDSKGNLLVTNEWDYYNSGNSVPSFKRNVNVYDSSGRLHQTLTYNTDTVNPATIIWNTYNDKGKLVETDERRRVGNAPDLSAFEKNDFWYDKKGRLYDKATYHPQVGLVKDEKITFDSTGKTITTYSYAANRVLTGTVEKRINNTINTTQEDTYDGDGMLTEYTISHDSAKHLMDKGVFHITYRKIMGGDRRYHNSEPGDTVMVHHIVNDNYFNTVEDDNFSNDGRPISQKSYQYNYDSIGNWIGKLQYNNNKPVKIIEREIGYFKE
jgi:hypothetical protein